MAAETGSAGEQPWPSAGNTVLVAVETDYEYYQLFGSTSSAINYAADLFAYASGYFTSEVGADFWLWHVSLWTSPADPWTQTNWGCWLFEFSRYWNTNMSGLQRTIAHFLSGKTAGGGMSWQGAMCAGAFSYDITGWSCSLTPAIDLYGGDYSFSGDLLGTFNISNPGVVWDIYVVSHEVGHHFNTGHTHCYLPPVDQCYNLEAGCYGGTPTLPCPTPGAGCGTIMSYCHTLTPGMSNISLTFGQGHPWGNAPGRVPVLMNAYLTSTAALYPRCLAAIVFADHFEAGDTSAWSSTSP